MMDINDELNKDVQENDRALRALVADYLRGCDGWREHPERANTHMQWEDLRAPERLLPTDLAALRQMTYETLAFRPRERKNG